jgi:hypothetical protein
VVAARGHESRRINVVVQLVELMETVGRWGILVDFILERLLVDDVVVDDYALILVRGQIW